MRLPNEAHSSRPWRIHEITARFPRLRRVGVADIGVALTTSRGSSQFATGDTARNPSWLARAFFAIRWKRGALLGWDDPDSGVGARVATLRERLPADLRDVRVGPEFEVLPFRSVYLTDNEWAAETANRTVHAVMHIGWVADAAGYRGQMRCW